MRYNVIAIEREYASGGREIGEALAKALGIDCHGRDIALRAAEELGITETELDEMEERVTGSILYSLTVFTDVTAGRAARLPKPEQLAVTETGIVREVAKTPCVIIGRGATGLFKDDPSVLRVFLYADEAFRVKRATQIYGIEAARAPEVCRKFDRRRGNYFRFATHANWRDPMIYDVILNTGKIGIPRATDILLCAAQ